MTKSPPSPAGDTTNAPLADRQAPAARLTRLALSLRGHDLPQCAAEADEIAQALTNPITTPSGEVSEERARELLKRFEGPRHGLDDRITTTSAAIRAIQAAALSATPTVREVERAASVREKSEITNEIGNSIAFEIYSQGDDYPSHPDLSHRIVLVKAKGPGTSISHQWTLDEARELHRLLALVFPGTRKSQGDGL